MTIIVYLAHEEVKRATSHGDVDIQVDVHEARLPTSTATLFVHLLCQQPRAPI